MARRTTDEWEALLGRWVYDKQPDKLLGARERFANVREQEKAAPEAVAEVVRLRRALEELRDTLSKTKIDLARGDYEYGHHTAFLSASSKITHILEGGHR